MGKCHFEGLGWNPSQTKAILSSKFIQSHTGNKAGDVEQAPGVGLSQGDLVFSWCFSGVF